MLIFLFLAALLNSNASRSAPLSNSFSIQARQSLIIPTTHRVKGSPTLDPSDFRDIQDILWSCFATIFACTWVAVHPNVPDPRRSGWTNYKHQVVTMLTALTAPEFVMVWALRQRIGAMKHAKEYNKKFNLTPRSRSVFWQGVDWFDDHKAAKEETPDTAWTITHGFLLEMRGLALFRDGKRLAFIEDVSEIPQRLDMAKDEVYDKSKGDHLTKLLVLVQTSWFIAQCVARWATNLYVTELEVITLAFACLNFFTYGLWWNKPQNMKVAIPIHTFTRPSRRHGARQNPPLQTQSSSSTDPEKIAQFPRKWERYIEVFGRKLFKGIVFILISPMIYLLVVFRAGAAMANSTKRPDSENKNYFGNYEFYSSENGSQIKAVVPACLVGLLFGGVHLIPVWLSHFISAGIRTAWMACAIWIIGQPVVFLFLKGLHELYWHYKPADHDPMSKKLAMAILLLFLTLFYTVLPFGFISYPIIRLILVGIAFGNLGSLPSSAYQSVDWSSFLPHI